MFQFKGSNALQIHNVHKGCHVMTLKVIMKRHLVQNNNKKDPWQS